jgi:hypothetical protein
MTLMDPITIATDSGFGAEMLLGSARALAMTSFSPVIGTALEYASGRRNLTDRELSARPGYGRGVQAFGQPRQVFNRSTNQYETEPVRPQGILGVADMFARNLPYASDLRYALAGKRQPYDTTTLFDLMRKRVTGGGKNEDLYVPFESNPPFAHIPIVTSLSRPFGVTVTRHNQEAENERYMKMYLRWLEGKKQTDAAKKTSHDFFSDGG